jgi:hypothetical protein
MRRNKHMLADGVASIGTAWRATCGAKVVGVERVRMGRNRTLYVPDRSVGRAARAVGDAS